jgi:hypothetical protein
MTTATKEPAKRKTAQEEEKMIIAFPKKIPCIVHKDKGEYQKDCPKCKELNKARKDKYTERIQGMAYEVISPVYKEQYNLAYEKLSPGQKEKLLPTHSVNKDKEKFIEKLKETITKKFYPWADTPTGFRLWREVLDELARKLDEGYVPEITTRDDFGRKTGIQTLW